MKRRKLTNILKKASAPVTEQELRALHKTADLLAEIKRLGSEMLRHEIRMDQAMVATAAIEIASEGRSKMERRVADVENDSGETKIRRCKQIGSNGEVCESAVNAVKVLRRSYSQGISM